MARSRDRLLVLALARAAARTAGVQCTWLTRSNDQRHFVAAAQQHRGVGG